jgi:glyoxylase-like metal-dependent hydrolase (beta-lactamase superfamily II)
MDGRRSRREHRTLSEVLMNMTRVHIALLAAAALLGHAALDAQQPAPSPTQNADVRVLPVKGNIWLLTAGGSNVVASIGKDGIMLVDTGGAAMTDKLLAAVQQLSRQVTAMRLPQKSCVGIVEGCSWWNSSTFLPTTSGPPSPKPIVGIVNTSFDPDHMGGNAALSAAGRSHIGLAAQDAWIMAHEKATTHLPKGSSVPSAAMPSEAYEGGSFKLNFFNGEGVVLWHMPAAHTDGDTIVQFRESEVLAAGDILNMAGYPVIDVEKGGTIQGLVNALNWILEMAVVEHMMEGGTIVVPGHGRLTDSADVAYYRDMVTIMRDRVSAAVKKGMTLQQIKAARLTRDYDGRFGRSTTYTPDMFIEAIHRTLNSKP